MKKFANQYHTDQNDHPHFHMKQLTEPLTMQQLTSILRFKSKAEGIKFKICKCLGVPILEIVI